MRQRRHPIIATLSRSMQAAYRKLRRNADILGRVLVYAAPSHGGYEEMELIYPDEVDNPVLLHGRVVLYDPRRSKQKTLFSA